MTNPFVQARQAAGLNRLAVAAAAARGVDTVRRFEAGQYPKVPSWAIAVYGRFIPEPERVYSDWRSQLAPPPETSTTENPLQLVVRANDCSPYVKAGDR